MLLNDCLDHVLWLLFNTYCKVYSWADIHKIPKNSCGLFMTIQYGNKSANLKKEMKLANDEMKHLKTVTSSMQCALHHLGFGQCKLAQPHPTNTTKSTTTTANLIKLKMAAYMHELFHVAAKSYCCRPFSVHIYSSLGTTCSTQRQ